MREAIGNTFIVNLIMVFIAVISALLIGSISYSKAFKVKNRIIYTIEKYGGWDNSSSTNIVRTEIEASLKDIGYQLKLANSAYYGGKVCPSRSGATTVYGGTGETVTYHYCVYEYNNEKGHYYGVTTFMHFDIPLIGNYIEFPVYGETRSLYDVGVKFNN
jgi:hypothetical protein